MVSAIIAAPDNAWSSGRNLVATPPQMMLIPGRSSKQGTSLNAGKLKDEYQSVTSTIEMNENEMLRLGLSIGDRVRLSCETGHAHVVCGKPRKVEDLPDGMIFIPYGPCSSELMESDTAGTGMPLSKQMMVDVQPA